MSEKTKQNNTPFYSPSAIGRKVRGEEQTSACLPVDFAELVSQSVENMRYFIGANQVHIESSVDDKKYFYGDPKLLTIILNNLISNGIKHRKQNFDDAQVKINVVADDKKAIINVIDNGVGIKSDDTNKIFDLFHRTDKKDLGAGMGLYLVKEIIAKLHGKILVESAENAGTEFTIEIPNLNAPANVITNDTNHKKYFQ